MGNLAARQDDMDPERIAYETFQLLGGTEQAGITVQQVLWAVCVEVIGPKSSRSSFNAHFLRNTGGECLMARLDSAILEISCL